MKIDLWEMIKNALPILWKFWPIWVILLAIIAIRLFFYLFDLKIDHWRIRRKFKKGETWRSNNELLQWLRRMKPWEFENYIAGLFSKLGYRIEVTGGSHDGGIDVIAEKDGITNYIQCKKFITSEVTVGAVRDFYGSLADHLANGKGYFITTNKFTLDAEKFVEDKPIELIDSFKLVKYIRMAEKGNKKTEVIKDKPKVCPDCGGNLIGKTGKYGKFLGCSNYPKCQYTENV